MRPTHTTHQAGAGEEDNGTVADSMSAPAIGATGALTAYVPIVISGGGIGGAALALALQQRGLPCVVFERDASVDMRRQGYGLTMQQGRHALAQLRLDRIPGINSQAHFSFDPTGTLLGCYGQAMRKAAAATAAAAAAAGSVAEAQAADPVAPDAVAAAALDSKSDGNGVAQPATRAGKHKRPPHHNIHLPRQRLRTALLNQLRPGTVQWGVSVERYEDVLHDSAAAASSAARFSANPVSPFPGVVAAAVASDARVLVRLSDGRSLWCSLLVGCDGLRSSIRAAKIGDPLNYLGVVVILGFARVQHPLARRRVVQTCDGHTRMYFMPFEAIVPDADTDAQVGDHASNKPLSPEAPAPAAPSSSSTARAASTAATPAKRETPAAPSAADEPGVKKAKSEAGVESCGAFSAAAIDGGDECRGGGCEDAEEDECSTMWQLSFPVSEAEALRLQASGGSGLKAEALRRCGAWHAPIPALLAATRDEDITGYPTYDRDLPAATMLRHGLAAATATPADRPDDSLAPPTASSSSSSASSSSSPAPPSSVVSPAVSVFDDGVQSRVTLLGDAAHPMSPFKGQGANQALLDAVSLAQAIHESALGAISSLPVARARGARRGGGASRTSGRPSLESALSRFESEMLSRSSGKVLESRRNVGFLHSPAVLAHGNHTRAFVAGAATREAQSGAAQPAAEDGEP